MRSAEVGIETLRETGRLGEVLSHMEASPERNYWRTLADQGSREVALVEAGLAVGSQRDQLRVAWTELADAFAQAARLLPSMSLLLAAADMYFLDLRRQDKAAELLQEAPPISGGRAGEWSTLLEIASLLLERAGQEAVDSEMRKFAETSGEGWSWDENLGLTVHSPAFLPETYRVITMEEHNQFWEENSEYDPRNYWLPPAAAIFEGFLRDWVSEGDEARPDLHALLATGDQEVLSALSGLCLCHSEGAQSGLAQSLFESGGSTEDVLAKLDVLLDRQEENAEENRAQHQLTRARMYGMKDVTSRGGGPETEGTKACGNPPLDEKVPIFRVRPQSMDIEVSGKLLDVPHQQRVILCLLYEKRGEICSRDEIGERVWGKSAYSPEMIDSAVSRLRTALRGVNPAAAKLIETRRRDGFRLNL